MSLLRAVEERLKDRFTGTITLHCHKGTVKELEVNEKIRTDPDGAVHLSESESVEVRGATPIGHVGRLGRSS